MKKLVVLTLTAAMTLTAAGFTMASDVPEGYTQTKVFDGSYGFGEAEITVSTNDDLSAFYITFECFDEEQILEGTVADGVVTVDYDLTGFVAGDAQQMWDDALTSENAWEGDGAESGEAADAAADESSGDAQADESADNGSEETQMPTVPTAESEDYTGEIREYPDKELWFDSTIYGGFYTAYQIVQGNGDDTFDIDKFINSEMGEKIMSRIKYELVLVGDDKADSETMIDYWAENGVIEDVYNQDDPTHEYLVFTPDYVFDEENEDVLYPVVFSCHGGGGTLFEAMDHGFVHKCYEGGFIVVCPDNEGMDPLYYEENLERYLSELEENEYPIDRTLIYLAGMSQGGMATMYAGLVKSNLVAAIAPHSSGLTLDASWQGQQHELGYAFPELTDEILTACKENGGLPMYLFIGECDMNQLPMSENMIFGLNRWLAMNGTNATEATDENMLGITADNVTVEVIDGAEHTTATFANEDGVVMNVITGIEGQPHWVCYSYADLAWDFLKQFSRVDGQLVVAE